MKKAVLCVLVIIIGLIILYFIGSGFIKNTSACINDFTVSSDGTEMTVNISVSSSTGFIREIKSYYKQDGKILLDCYSAFGGINGNLGAKNEFTFNLNDDSTVIAINRGSKYEDILIKNEDGFWDYKKQHK